MVECGWLLVVPAPQHPLATELAVASGAFLLSFSCSSSSEKPQLSPQPCCSIPGAGGLVLPQEAEPGKCRGELLRLGF